MRMWRRKIRAKRVPQAVTNHQVGITTNRLTLFIQACLVGCNGRRDHYHIAIFKLSSLALKSLDVCVVDKDGEKSLKPATVFIYSIHQSWIFCIKIAKKVCYA